ncbi:alcohol dehydrogenase, partial [Mycena olivaceomarginata]
MAPIQNARVLFGSIPENPSVKSYLPPFKIGAPLDGYGVGIVLRSETAGVQVGKYVYGLTILHQEYTVYPELAAPGLSLTAYVTAAGMPTAYAAWREYSDAKPGEVAFVTSGAGLSRIVIQLAKQAGLKVIASAGSEEKVKFMQSIGADVAFNYKTTDTGAVLEKEGPIDIFWDNVGGDIIDVAIEASAHKARILACGSIAGLNTGHAGGQDFHQIVRKALHVHGILILDLLPKYQADFYATIPPNLPAGNSRLSTVGDVFLAVLKGTKKAKAVV